MSLCHYYYRRLQLTSQRRILGVVLVLATAALSSTAFAQEYAEFRTLGTSNAVFKPGPQSGAELQRMFAEHRADYEKVLNDTNWPGDHDDLFNAVANGDFAEAQYPVGHTFEWMAVRKRGVVQATGRLRWAGRAPFEAFEIRFESQGREHRFLIPKACGNLSLIQMRDVGPPPLTAVPSLNVQSPNQCTGTNVTVDVTVAGMPDDASLEFTLTRPSGQQETLSPTRSGGGYRWQGKLDDAGAYAFSATVSRGSERTQTVTERLTLQPCEPTCTLQLTPPPMDPTPRKNRASLGIDMCSSAARTGSLTSKAVSIYHTPVDGPEQLIETLSLDAECSASYVMPDYGSYRVAGKVVDDRGMESTCQDSYTLMEPERKLEPYFTIFGGKERRVREHDVATGELADDNTTETFLSGRCAPLFGGTIGVALPFADGGAQLFGQGGIVINTRDTENTSGFADIGVDKNFEGGYFGGGVGVWDFTHSDTIDGSIFLHGGFDITETLQWNFEGRVFMSELGEIENNYAVFAGIRYFFR
jgi:hypothetical protein